MTFHHKDHKNDITPWESSDNQQENNNITFNFRNLTKLNQLQKSKNKPFLQKKSSKNKSAIKKQTKNISYKMICNLQIPNTQPKIKNQRLKTHHGFKESKLQQTQMNFNNLIHKNQTSFLPNKQIKLQEMFPSYSLKRFNRNKTFYRQSGLKSIQIQSSEPTKTQFQDDHFNINQKQFTLSNFEINLKPNQPQSIEKKKSCKQNVKQRQQNYEFRNNFLKNQERFKKTILYNITRKDPKFVTVFNKKTSQGQISKSLDKEGIVIANGDKARKVLVVSKSFIERGQRFNELIEEMRSKENSIERQQGVFFSGDNRDFVQLKTNKWLHLPKIQLIQISQPSK